MNVELAPDESITDPPVKKHKSSLEKSIKITNDDRVIKEYEGKMNAEYREAEENTPKKFGHNEYICPEDEIKLIYDAANKVPPMYNMSTQLTPEQRAAAHSGLFDLYDIWYTVMGANDGLCYPKPSKCVIRIPTDPERPEFKIPAYRQDDFKRKYIYDCVKLLHKYDIISLPDAEHLPSCYSSLLAVPKPGAPISVLRMAHDLRALNETTLPGT